MGLFSLVGDIVGTMLDMGKLKEQQDVLEKSIEGLISAGKCPDDLKAAYDAVKNADPKAELDTAMGTMNNFIGALQKNKAILPADAQEHVDKFAEIVADLKKKTDDVNKTTAEKKE